MAIWKKIFFYLILPSGFQKMNRFFRGWKKKRTVLGGKKIFKNEILETFFFIFFKFSHFSPLAKIQTADIVRNFIIGNWGYLSLFINDQFITWAYLLVGPENRDHKPFCRGSFWYFAFQSSYCKMIFFFCSNLRCTQKKKMAGAKTLREDVF